MAAPPEWEAEMAAAAERFRAKFLDLVERQQGQSAGPDDPPVIHHATRFWSDPEGVIAEMRACAQDAQSRRQADGRC